MQHDSHNDFHDYNSQVVQSKRVVLFLVHHCLILEQARAIAAERSLDEIKFGKPTSFSTALFKTRYENVETPKQQYQVMAAVHQLISRYCEETGIPKSEGDKFFEELQAEAFSNKHELLKEVPSACLRLWTSAKQLRQREFCSILNEMIRADNKYVMDEVTMISRGINSLCATRNSEDKRLVEWPADHILFRGSGLPEDKQEFFIPGTKYRCPMYLATSKNMMVSKKTFCARAAELGLPPVLWIIHLDPKYGCVHVNFVDRTNIPGEQEFLFVPYSTFEVLSADFKDQPTWLEPHVIHIRAEIDNKLCSDDLPLSPWH